eukprot:scpid95128/ scgid33079/ 
MATFYKWISICPVESCALDYKKEPPTEWIIVKCGGTSYLGDNGIFACSHMIVGSSSCKSCPHGNREFPFVESAFKCSRHGTQFKRMENPDTLLASMNAAYNMIFLTRPHGVEDTHFMRWLARSSRAIREQYVGH